MAHSTVRRSPARRSPEPRGAPATRLAPHPTTWARDATLCVAAGLAGAGAAPVLGHRVLVLPALGAGILLGLVRAAVGARARARRQLGDLLLEALAPGLGLRVLDRRAVRVRSWTRGWPGVPRHVDLHYAPGVDDSDPAWLAELVAAVGRRLLGVYGILHHDRHLCRLKLGWLPPAPPAPAAPAVQVRAERTITELLGPTAVVTSVRWSPEGQLAALAVCHEAGPKLAAAGYRHRVERVLSTMLPGRWRAVWDMEGDRVRFEVRPSFPANLWLPVLQVPRDRDVLATYDDLEIPYGVDEDGQEMVWRPARDPNLMLVGAPGTGKTVTAHTLLVNATRYEWPVWVVDGKSIEFLGFQDWPNVQVVATSIQEQVAVIHRAWELMEHRYDLITSGRARESDFEPLLVFLDEFADFRGNLTAWYADVKVKGDPAKPAVLGRVQSIARKGRTSRVHLVFATQRPDAEYFGGDMRDNFRMRVSMGRLSPQGAMMMWESPTVGTSIPRGCRGRATTINDDNRAVESQTYRAPDPRKTVPGSDEDALVHRLRPRAVRHQRLLILPPQALSELDSLDGDPPPQATYTDYAAASWVLASTRPDLDPVHQRARQGRAEATSASPMTLFGLAEPPRRATGQPAPARSPRELLALPAPREPHVPAAPAGALHVVDPSTQPGSGEQVGFGYDVDDDDEYAGHGLPHPRLPARLAIGDLILLEQDEDVWVLIDADPEEDLTDPDCIALSWRADGDEHGSMSVPADQPLPARRPLDSDTPLDTPFDSQEDA